MRANIDLAHGYETLLWQYAYLHGETERAMPILAQAPLRTDLPHLVDHRAWQLQAYQSGPENPESMSRSSRSIGHLAMRMLPRCSSRRSKMIPLPPISSRTCAAC
jgi:hypothetical protein